MIYLPLLVFLVVTIWIAGWRKGSEIAAASAFLCLMFGLTFSANTPELPLTIWRGFIGVLYLPLYLVRHPGEWLYFFAPSILLASIWLLIVGLPKIWKKLQH